MYIIMYIMYKPLFSMICPWISSLKSPPWVPGSRSAGHRPNRGPQGIRTSVPPCAFGWSRTCDFSHGNSVQWLLKIMGISGAKKS